MLKILLAIPVAMGCNSSDHKTHDLHADSTHGSNYVTEPEPDSSIWKGEIRLLHNPVLGVGDDSEMDTVFAWAGRFQTEETEDGILRSIDRASFFETLLLLDSNITKRNLTFDEACVHLKKGNIELIGQSSGNGHYAFLCERDAIIYIDKSKAMFWALRKGAWERKFSKNNLLAIFRLDARLMPVSSFKRKINDKGDVTNFLESYRYDTSINKQSFLIVANKYSGKLALEFEVLNSLLIAAEQCHNRYFAEFGKEDLASWNEYPLWTEPGYAYPIPHRFAPECGF